MPPDTSGLRHIDEAAAQDRPPPTSLTPVSTPTHTENPPALKILILDDEPADAELMQRALHKAGLDFTARRVDKRDDFIAVLETFAPDVLLLDCKLQGYSGAEALAHARHVHPEIPVVIVTGTLGDEAAIELLKSGAKDYVLKSNLLRLPSAVERAILVEQGIRARKSAEAAQRAARQLIEGILNTIPARVFWKDKNLVYLGCNAAFAHDAGFADPEDIVGKDDYQMGWRDQAELYRSDDREVIETGRSKLLIEEPQTTPNGESIALLTSKIPLRSANGEIEGILGTYLDITARKQAEAQIREDEAKFRGLVEQNVAGIIIIGQDGKIAYINPYWARLNGYTPTETIGHSLFEYIPEAEKPRVGRELTRQLSGEGDFVQLATSMLTKDGRTIDLLVNASPAIYEGKPASIAMLLDVTETNKAQRQLALNAAVLATEHELSPDGILVVDPTDQIISVNRRFAEIFGVPAQLLADKADAPVLALVVGQVADGVGFLSRVHDLYTHPEESSHDEIALKDGRVLDRYSAPMHRPDRGFMGRVWFFRDITERKRAEETLRTGEERFRLLVEQAPDAILLYDFDQNRFIDANKAAERLFACGRDEILKHGPQHFYPSEQPDQRAVPESFTEHNRRALTGEEITYERRILNASGQERLCQVTLVRLPSASPRLLRASFIDITDQKTAERALLRLNRTLRTLSRGNEVLVRTTSEAELLKEMCRVVVDTGGYRMAWVGIVEHDAAKSVTPVAWAGEIGQYLEKAQITWADEPRGRGPHGRAIRSGKPQVTQNLQTDPSMVLWQELARESGFLSSAVLPLKDASGVFALLAIHSAETDAYDLDEVKLLEELADDLAFGIRSLREHNAHEELNRRWRASLEATVGAIANTVEMRDPYTAGHQQRVARLAVAMARELALPEPQIQGLYLAGIIHDVGKIDIPSEILNKPGKLSKLQFQLIQGHAHAGYDIVKGVDFPWPIAQMILQHHERLDGSGYPQGLKGEAILPEAKILAVADVVEAMVSHRPYRAALGIDAALDEIEKGKGRLYDPAAADACIALFRRQAFSFSC